MVAFAGVLAIMATVAPGSARTSDAVVPPRPAPAGAPCASPSYVAALGWTCPGPDGLYEVLLGDGTTGLSHGGDPWDGHLGGGDLRAKQRNPACVKRQNDEFHIQPLYVHPSDQGSRYTTAVGDIRAMIRQATGMLFQEAREFKRSRTFRVACAGKTPSVIEVGLASINERQDYAQVLTEVRRAGFANPLAKYWIYYDGRPPDAPGGTALMAADQRLVGNNQNNFGPFYAVTWGIPSQFGGAGVMMHELAHTLGAVQADAPNSTRAAHCNDGQDIMCYDDGGSAASYRRNVCLEVHFDCRHNDYFHPNPKKGSYLATNWNLGSPRNRFFAGCSYRTGRLTVDPESAATGTHLAKTGRFAVPKGCRGHAYGLTSTIPPLPREAYPTLGLVPYPLANPTGSGYVWFGPEHRLLESVAQARPVIGVCFFKGSKQLSCRSGESGKVPKAAKSARVHLTSGAEALWVLSVD